MTKYQRKLEQALKEVVGEMIYDQEPFSIIVAVTDDWEFPLPREILENNVMRLSLSGWALEQARLDPDLSGGLYVRVAFGDEENSRTFDFSEIHGVLDAELKPLFQRVFDSKDDTAKYTLKGLMRSKVDEEGVKRSMDAMRKYNPNMGKGESDGE